MKKRVWLLLLLSVVILGLCLAGCGHADDPLTVMGKKSDMAKSYMTSIFAQYEEATGNKLEIIAVEDAEFEDVAEEKFASGEGPDILIHFHNAELGRFDVDEHFCYLDDVPWIHELTDSARAYCTDHEGHLLGLPFWENSISGCYYNKTLLNKLGLKPAKTQEEFDTLCQTIADSGYTPICWPADGCSWMPQFGLDPVFAGDPELLERLNQEKTAYADIPAVKNMVQWLEHAAEAGWFGDNYLQTGWEDISGIMGSGEAVMTFIWDTWFYTDFAQDGQYTTEDFAVMPIFMNTAEQGTYEGGNLNMMMVNKNSDRKEKALEFLEFCADEAHYNTAFDGIATISCFKNQTTSIQSPMVTAATDSIMAHIRMSTAVSQIDGYSAEDMVAALNQLFRGKTDVDSCIGQMDQARVQAIEDMRALSAEE